MAPAYLAVSVWVEEYRREGWAVVPGALDADTTEVVLEHLADVAVVGALATVRLDVDPLLTAVVARLEALAAAALGAARPVPFGCTYVVKPPGSGLPALWHQDAHPWRERLGIEHAVTVAVSLDGSGPDNGGMQVLPGTHLGPAHPLQARADPPSVFGHETDPAVVAAAGVEPVHVVLAPGDASVHHPRVLHGSGPNTSDRPRTVLAVRYRV